MTAVKAGYQVAIIDPEGIIIFTLDLEGYNLDKSLAKSSIGEELHDALTEAKAYE
ncbi:hypothetical protein LCGC14_2260780 [marine sediment metagenome]|uniref:Uncharacterized protein n=1 Tax=marine sediment metagenome TaxID=412755 RepID=A0A0F9FC52_9ZZZZ